MENFAKQLLGISLEGGWKVTKILENKHASGGQFSVGYIVENADGRKGFLKALDYSRARGEKNMLLALQEMLEAYNFERRLLDQCKEHKLTRVVKAIDAGRVIIDPNTIFEGTVEYLIFELADGDIRHHLDSFSEIDASWILRCLHQIATGLYQLHRIDIAHQDLKPSNVLVFGNKAGSKIADLGRAVTREPIELRHTKLPYAGDPLYAPLEAKYNHRDPDWTVRRFGCDAYLLGSMVAFLFARVTMTGAVLAELDPSQRPYDWHGTYVEVLPYVRNAFGKAMERIRVHFPSGFEDHLVVILRELCEPDPRLRGHSKNLNTQFQYSLERYVTQFDLLAGRVELAIMRKKIA